MAYLYIPFANTENNNDLRRLAGQWVAAVARDTSWKNPPEIRIHGSMAAPLNDVQASETVYVLGHGGAMEDWIAADPNGNTLMRYDQLARRMFGDGLSLRHRKVKLYFCNPFRGPIREFATHFKQEMWQLNYSGALEVYYYEGSVSTPREEAPGVYHKQSTAGALRMNADGVAYPARSSETRRRA